MIICTMAAQEAGDSGAFNPAVRKFCEEHGKSRVAWLA